MGSVGPPPPALQSVEDSVINKLSSLSLLGSGPLPSPSGPTPLFKNKPSPNYYSNIKTGPHPPQPLFYSLMPTPPPQSQMIRLPPTAPPPPVVWAQPQPQLYNYYPPTPPPQVFATPPQVFATPPPTPPIFLSPPSPFYSLLYSIRNGFKSPLDHPAYLHFSSLPFPTQLLEFQRTLTITASAYQQRLQVLRDLSSLLQQGPFPSCKTYIFGSFLTFLGDDDSDIDLYVDAFNTTELGAGAARASSDQVLDACATLLGMAKAPGGRWLCDKVEPLRETRVPIIKIRHYNGVNCDLSFENITSLRNSKMIQFYGELHPLVRPFLVFLRYWGRFHQLTGSLLIKNYCLVLMGLAFLQGEGLIPAVGVLQEVKRMERRMLRMDWNPEEIDGWDTSFCDNVHAIRSAYPPRIPATTSSTPQLFLEMLEKFFDFYSTYGIISSFVISPFYGKPLSRPLFNLRAHPLLPPEFGRYVNKVVGQGVEPLSTKSVLVVQDPFVLNFNVAGTSPVGIVEKFRQACELTGGLVRIERMKGNPNLLKLFDNIKATPTGVGGTVKV